MRTEEKPSRVEPLTRRLEESTIAIVGLGPRRVRADAVILAVPHAPFRRDGWELVLGLLDRRQGLVADIKAILPRELAPDGVELWRL